VVLTPVNDTAAESTETVKLTIASSASDAYRVGAASSATMSIDDNDTAPFATTLSWSTRASSPVPRGEAETAVFDNKLYVFGGYTDFTATNSTRCDVYDPATNTWTRIADMPVGVTHGGTAVVGRDVYIACGYTGGPGGSQTFATTQVQKYNVDTNTWTTITPLPQARGGGAMAAIQTTALESELHYFGGSDSSRLDRTEHWAFNLDNPSAGWVARAPILTSRTHMGAVTIAKKIYAVGGQKNQDAAESPQAALERYDPATDTWTALASMPFGRSHIASATVVVNNHIVTLGGETTYQSSINNVTAYDPVSNSWQELTPLPSPKASGVGAFIAGNYYYTTGGVSASTYKGTPIS
jgi:N-acetylneuraminic acid mutarotase